MQRLLIFIFCASYAMARMGYCVPTMYDNTATKCRLEVFEQMQATPQDPSKLTPQDPSKLTYVDPFIPIDFSNSDGYSFDETSSILVHNKADVINPDEQRVHMSIEALCWAEDDDNNGDAYFDYTRRETRNNVQGLVIYSAKCPRTNSKSWGDLFLQNTSNSAKLIDASNIKMASEFFGGANVACAGAGGGGVYMITPIKNTKTPGYLLSQSLKS